jgi:hypothetical protein
VTQETGAVPAAASPEPTDVLKLTALDLYLKSLKPHADRLRAAVAAQMKADHDERKGAVLPDGTKIGAVSYRKGAKSARITDDAAALRWCLKNHPEQIMQSIRPAYLAMLLDAAKVDGAVGDKGVDPHTGEVLDFIEVTEGAPGVTITSTPEGKARMAALAGGYAAMITPPSAPTFPDNDPYDAEFADRLTNGGYK